MALTQDVLKKSLIKSRMLYVLIFLLISWFITIGHTGTWRDNFNDDRLNGWTHITTARRAAEPWESTWEVKDNMLETWLTVHFNNPRLGMVADFLELTAFPLQDKHFVVEGISIKKSRIGSFGIAIGVRLPPEDRKFGSVYLFHTWGIRQMQFDETGHFFIVDPPGIFFDSQIEHLKVVFDAGHFQVFSADEWVKEIEDAAFETINLLGLMIFGDGLDFATMDEFVISGPGIPDGGGDLAVHPTNKLATTWGSLKRRIPSF